MAHIITYLSVCRNPYCQRQAIARGLCDTCYRMERRGQQLRPIRVYGARTPCSVTGCTTQATRRGLCDACYQRRRRGLPLEGK